MTKTMATGGWLSLVCAALLCGQDPTLAAVRETVGFDPRPGSTVPLDAEFRADDGRRTTLGEVVAGKPTVLAMVYFGCPVLCDQTVRELARTTSVLSLSPEEEYRVVLISIDRREGPAEASGHRETIRGFAGGSAGGPGWALLTGAEPAIRSVADAIRFRYRPVDGGAEFAHASGITLLTPDGRVSGAFRGVDYPPRDLRLGLIEAGGGGIGGIADRVLLLCYAWDPSAGRYGLAIARILQIGGVVTVLGIGVGLWLLSRRGQVRCT